MSAFLFVGKILDGNIKWIDLYVGRVLRIMPLWLLMVVLSLCILYLDFGLRLNGEIYYAGRNASVSYSMVTSGVTWSLWYEWILYILLPLIAFSLRKESFSSPIMLSLIFALLLIFVYNYKLVYFSYFCIGGLSAYFLRNEWCLKFFKSKSVRILFLIFGFTGYYYFSYSSFPLGLVFLFCYFFAVATGADLFNFLGGRVSYFLSEMGFSLYLLQGPFLYLIYKSLGFDFVHRMSDLNYFALIFFITPLYVKICSISYKYIELKFCNTVVNLYFIDKLRKCLRR